MDAVLAAVNKLTETWAAPFDDDDEYGAEEEEEEEEKEEEDDTDA